MTPSIPNTSLPSQTREDVQTLEDALSRPCPQEDHIEVTETIQISDHISDVPAKPETIQEINDWSKHQRESTRSKLSILLVKFFGASLAGTFLLVSIAVFQPTVDKTAIKDYIPLILTPQVTLLGVALGFYFGDKEN